MAKWQSPTYTTHQTLNGKVNDVRLKEDIEMSEQNGLGLITKGVDAISINRGMDPVQFSVIFKDTLSEGEQLVLTNVVANHTGVPVAVPTVRLDGVYEEDNRLNTVTAPVPPGWTTYFCGRGDDPSPSSGSGRGTGPQIYVECPGGTSTPSETLFSFIEPVYLHDGEVNWGPLDVDGGEWKPTDHFSFGVRFAASSATAASGDGNANSVDISGIAGPGALMYVPNGAGQGPLNVNLATACPIPALNKDGYWSVDEYTGTISPSIPGEGSFNLYNFPPPDAWFLRCLPTAATFKQTAPDVYRAEYIHQSYTMVFQGMKASAGGGWLAGFLLAFRRRTTA
jgi:hypothetical protein